MYGLERILRLSRCRRRLMVLLKWLSDLPFVRLRLKGEREDAFREMLEKDSRLIDELHGEVLQLKERFYAQEACLETGALPSVRPLPCSPARAGV